ncbi:MAG: fused MFS/spermidine synthase [Betaproteobacteria bacterium]|nr:fused MFS/spermidine synthase [Betaproteobacteria bacterium]
MLLYAATIFISAFLLFLVQPIMAKQILPWFGGSSAVWTTCMVFFQFLLLGGYAYSDWTTRKLRARSQVLLHIALLALSLASLPIIADAAWKPAGSEDPVLRILGLLLATIGLPYFLLSTTGPLVQVWFARTFPAGTVYRLFALSNFGSLLALIAYPPAIEPWVTTLVQSWGWSAGYALFVLLCIGSAVYSMRGAPQSVAARETLQAMNDGPQPTWGDYALWLLLSAMGSFLLLAVTNHITHDVASVPFLWILPLTIYLLTFILCFEGRGWYKRKVFLWPMLIALGVMAYSLQADRGVVSIKEAIPLYSAGLFVCCMFCHGELADMKPAPRYLTSFYLMVSLGGALGGLFVGVVAPRIFNTYYEFGAGLIVLGALAAYLARRMARWVLLAVVGATGFTAFQVYAYVNFLTKDAWVMKRNFYGTLRVKDTGAEDEGEAVRRLINGVIMHGEQYLAPEKRNTPTTYYGPTSGVGLALKYYEGVNARVGVIGLGAGTLAVYGKPGDIYRFYEINPQVIEVAQRDFWFLGNSRAKIETVLGDARLNLEREPQQHYDVLAVDAFSSDSIPVHLLTKEAMAVYLRHVKPDGVLAFHVTNRFLELAPVVKRIADEYRIDAVLISDDAEDTNNATTDWVLVTRNRRLLEQPEIKQAASKLEAKPGGRAWTDDFNNLFQILK